MTDPDRAAGGSGGAVQAGYSGTPLIKKLGIKDHHRVMMVGPAPELPDVRSNVRESEADSQSVDVLLAFVASTDEFQSSIRCWSEAINVDGAIWVCWPKKSARKVIPSDMTEDVIREFALPMGLVDNKVCAVNEVWSGLRLVWRVELRLAKRQSAK